MARTTISTADTVINPDISTYFSATDRALSRATE